MGVCYGEVVDVKGQDLFFPFSSGRSSWKMEGMDASSPTMTQPSLLIPSETDRITYLQSLILLCMASSTSSTHNVEGEDPPATVGAIQARLEALYSLGKEDWEIVRAVIDLQRWGLIIDRQMDGYELTELAQEWLQGVMKGRTPVFSSRRRESSLPAPQTPPPSNPTEKEKCLEFWRELRPRHYLTIASEARARRRKYDRPPSVGVKWIEEVQEVTPEDYNRIQATLSSGIIGRPLTQEEIDAFNRSLQTPPDPTPEELRRIEYLQRIVQAQAERAKRLSDYLDQTFQDDFPPATPPSPLSPPAADIKDLIPNPCPDGKGSRKDYEARTAERERERFLRSRWQTDFPHLPLEK